MKIKQIHARQIIDSRATPTIEVDLYLEDGSMGRAAVPSGASTGSHEALELRDNDQSKYFGKSVLQAVENVNQTIASQLVGQDYETQESLDSFLLALDGTPNKQKLGANAILGVSLAFAHAVAESQNIPLFKLINEIYGKPKMVMPSPMFNIMNGGKHANWSTDIQEFMVIVKAESFAEQLETASEVFLALGKVLEEAGLDTDVGNEGGYAPGFKSNTEALDYIMKAIAEAGHVAGRNVFLSLDVAASEFFNSEAKRYELKTEERSLTPEEWTKELEIIMEKYPLICIEDPYAEDDWDSWISFTSTHGSKIQIVGDDLLVTNTDRIQKAVTYKACNSLLVKPNQIGTLTETMNAMKSSERAGWKNIISHRSGETEDITIAHIAVGTAAGQIKTGAPSRGERTAKYNELTRIAEEINKIQEPETSPN
jgi:enolase